MRAEQDRAVREKEEEEKAAEAERQRQVEERIAAREREKKEAMERALKEREHQERIENERRLEAEARKREEEEKAAEAERQRQVEIDARSNKYSGDSRHSNMSDVDVTSRALQDELLCNGEESVTENSITRVTSAPGRVGGSLGDTVPGTTERPNTALAGKINISGPNARKTEILETTAVTKEAWHQSHLWDGNKTEDTISMLNSTGEDGENYLNSQHLRWSQQENSYDDSFTSSVLSDTVEENLSVLGEGSKRSRTHGPTSGGEEVEDEMQIFSSPMAVKKRQHRLLVDSGKVAVSRSSVGEDSAVGSYDDDFEEYEPSDRISHYDGAEKSSSFLSTKVFDEEAYFRLVSRCDDKYLPQREYWTGIETLVQRIDVRNLEGQEESLRSLLNELLSSNFPSKVEELFCFAGEEMKLYENSHYGAGVISAPLASASIVNAVATCVRILASVIQMCLSLTDSYGKSGRNADALMDLLHDTRMSIFSLHTILIDFCTSVLKFEHNISTIAGPTSLLSNITISSPYSTVGEGRKIYVLEMVGMTEDAWSLVLTEIAMLFGLLTTVSGHGGSYLSLCTDDATGESRPLKKYFGEELSISSQWCLISALCDMMKWSRQGADGYHAGTIGVQTATLKKQCLKSLGAVIAVNGTCSLHEMLLAQQVPRTLCEMLSVEGLIEGVSCSSTVVASAVHVLALLLHTTGPHWFHEDGEPSFPLVAILGNFHSQHAPDDENPLSAAATLRHRICKDVLKWLLEGRGSGSKFPKRLDVLLRVFVEITATSSATSGQTSFRTDLDINNVIVLQSAVGRVLFHLTNEGDVGERDLHYKDQPLLQSMCDYIYCHGDVINLIFVLVSKKIERPSTAPTVSTPDGHHIDTFSLGLSLLTLRNLAAMGSLSYDHLLMSLTLAINAGGVFKDDIRILPACCSLLSAIIRAKNCTLSEKQKTPLTLDQKDFLFRTAASKLLSDASSLLASAKYILDGRDVHIAATKNIQAIAPVIQSLVGSDYGSRSEGILDGILQLLQDLGERAGAQLFCTTLFDYQEESSLGLQLLESTCHMLQSAVMMMISTVMSEFVNECVW